ncbi:25206_t:CDS:2, partial [Gigaspora margarita]
LELNYLTQQEHERVDTYATKFKRLLNHVNTKNCLPVAYIVRMFLDGLKDIYAALVAIVVPKSLSKAVAAARRVEAGNYYGRHNTQVAKQVRVGSKLSDLKKRIDKIALNYAILTSKIKDAPAISKNKTKIDNTVWPKEVYGLDKIISKFERIVMRNYTPAWFSDMSEDSPDEAAL